MTRVADTSALYALLNGKDLHHAQAREAFDDLETILVPDVILTETIDLIAYRHNAAKANEALTALLELPHLRVAQPVHIEAVVRIHKEAKGRLSLADAYVVQTCRVVGADPLTFDKRLRKMATPSG